MEFFTESLPSLLGAASAAVPLLQSQRHHERELEAATELHKQAIRQAAALHSEALSHGEQLHRDGLRVDLEHHLEDIRLTIEAARRENLRDVWAQKSRRAETLLIMSSLMIGGFFSLVVEGLPPIDVWPALLSLYSVCLALSFSALFLCLFLSMKFSSRMTDFNIYKPHQIYTCGNTHESFESYYECHCAQPAHAASVMFYAGTLLLVTAAALLQFSRWYLTYGNAVAASLYVGVAGVTMASLMLFYRLLPTKTRAANTPTQAEDAESDARAMEEGRMGDIPALVPMRRVATSGIRIKRRRNRQQRNAGDSDDDASSFRRYLSELRVNSLNADAATGQTVDAPASPRARDDGDLTAVLSASTRKSMANVLQRTESANVRTVNGDASIDIELERAV